MTPITYTVKFRTAGLFRRLRVLKDVDGDGLLQDIGLRFFKLITGELIYIPIQTEVHFSKEREVAIHSKIKEEAGR